MHTQTPKVSMRVEILLFYMREDATTESLQSDKFYLTNGLICFPRYLEFTVIFLQPKSCSEPDPYQENCLLGICNWTPSHTYLLFLSISLSHRPCCVFSILDSLHFTLPTYLHYTKLASAYILGVDGGYPFVLIKPGLQPATFSKFQQAGRLGAAYFFCALHLGRHHDIPPLRCCRSDL